MAASTTTFEERIARIHQRAAQGTNTGFVQPGVADELTSSRAAKKAAKRARKKQKKRGGYLVSILGGLATSVAIVGVCAVVLMSGTDGGSFEDIAAILLLPSQ